MKKKGNINTTTGGSGSQSTPPPANVVVTLSVKAVYTCVPGTTASSPWTWSLKIIGRPWSAGSANDLGAAKAAAYTSWQKAGHP